MNKLVVVLKVLMKSKTTWKLVGTLLVTTGLINATNLVSLMDTLEAVTDGLAMVS